MKVAEEDRAQEVVGVGEVEVLKDAAFNLFLELRLTMMLIMVLSNDLGKQAPCVTRNCSKGLVEKLRFYDIQSSSYVSHSDQGRAKAKDQWHQISLFSKKVLANLFFLYILKHLFQLFGMFILIQEQESWNQNSQKLFSPYIRNHCSCLGLLLALLIRDES